MEIYVQIQYTQGDEPQTEFIADFGSQINTFETPAELVKGIKKYEAWRAFDITFPNETRITGRVQESKASGRNFCIVRRPLSESELEEICTELVE